MSDLELAGRRSHGRLSNLVKVKRTEVASTQDGKKKYCENTFSRHGFCRREIKDRIECKLAEITASKMDDTIIVTL